MAQKLTYTSDLTGKDIADDSEHATLVILSHPTIDQSVRIDAHALEAAHLKDESVDLVNVQIHLPNYPPEEVWITLAKFDKLFGKDIDPQTVLERVATALPPVTVRRPGRPAGSANKPAGTRKASGSGKSPEELAAVRAWLASQGIEANSRGRIKAELLAQYDAAHQS